MKFFKSARVIGIFGIGKINSDGLTVLSVISLKVTLQGAEFNKIRLLYGY